VDGVLVIVNDKVLNISLFLKR